MSCDIAEWCDVERLEKTTDYSQETFVEERQFFSDSLWVLRGIHSAYRLIKLSPNLNVEILILYVKHTIRCGLIKAMKVRCRYSLFNT